MPRSRQPEGHFPVKLTQAQRKAVAEIAPELTDRLKLDERNQRTIPFTLPELKAIHWLANNEAPHAEMGRKRVTPRSPDFPVRSRTPYLKNAHRLSISASRFRATSAVASSRSVASHRRLVALAAARKAPPPA